MSTAKTRAQSDAEFGVHRLMGSPDGPVMYIEELDMDVPTFIDPRDDLIPQGYNRRFSRLSHHIPIAFRGDYTPEQLPEEYVASAGGPDAFRVNSEGFVLCGAHRVDGGLCGSKAVNRSGLCRNHGGALHPADKLLAGTNLSITKVEPERIASLDRVQRFIAGLMEVSELDDDEVAGCFVRNDQGVAISGFKIGVKFEQQITKELHIRLNRFLRSKTPEMLKIMCDIAESDLVEAADRIKAIQWISERTMGKTPDVLLVSGTDKPYEAIFEQIESGSREEFRAIEQKQTIDAEIVTTWDSNDDYSDPESEPSEWSGTDDGVDARSEHGLSAEIPIDDPMGFADEIIRKQKEAKELRERVSRAKRRRYAARAQGVGLSGDIAWLVQWRACDDGSGEWIGVLVPPEKQSKRLLDKLSATG